MKKELASGNGTASSFNCRSAIGRGRGLMGISGSSSSSSPTMCKKAKVGRLKITCRHENILVVYVVGFIW